MNVVCLDLEGVLAPEIWIAFADKVGIPELRRTTRDEPLLHLVDLLRFQGRYSAPSIAFRNSS